MALEDLYDRIIAVAVLTFRNHSIMPRLVDNDVASELAEYGDTVNINVVQPATTSPVVPAPVRPGGRRPNTRRVALGLDHWEDSAFTLTDREITSMSKSADYIPKELQASAIAIANAVDAQILSNYTGVYGVAGQAGVTPFATSTLEAQEATRVLSSQHAPKGHERHMVLDEFAYANAIGVPTLQRVDASGASLTLREGIVGRALGFWWHEDTQVPRHTTGTAAGYLVDQNNVEVGFTFINIDTGTGSFLEGDIFTVEGDDQTYVVTQSDETGGNDSTLRFSPPAKVAWANNAPITFMGDDHVVNLAFSQHAFAFASRPATVMAVNQQIGADTSRVRTWVDMDEMGNGSGIVMSLEVSREHYQTSYYLSCMWGSMLVDGALACRILG